MRITDVQVYLVKSHRQTPIPSPWVLVQVFTDEGVVGLGDATNWPGGTIIAQAVRELKRVVMGQDPFQIELLYHEMYERLHQIGQTGACIAAISGIEIALWDIVGQACGQPIYNLLGGACRDLVRTYSHAQTPDATAELVAKGYTACKCYFRSGVERPGERIRRPMSVTLEEEKQILAYMLRHREAAGDAVDLCNDSQARFTVSAAIRIGRRLEEVGLLFYEEPVSSENIEALADVRRAVNVPICVGERRYTRYGFRDIIASQAVDMIMPDVPRTGGIMETKKIAAFAESYYLQVMPHNPNSPIATLASLQVMANIPNGLLLEYVDDDNDVPWRNELLTDPPEWEAGYLKVPTKPGLGTKLNMDTVKKYAFEG